MANKTGYLHLVKISVKLTFCGWTLHTYILQVCLNSSRIVVDLSIRRQNKREDPRESVSS